MKGEIKITNFEYCKQIARVAHFGQFRKFTTVERIRRKIQAEGRYPPTDPRVAVQRANRQEAMRILYSPKEEATKVEGRVNQRTVEEYYDEQ
jgi:hypothetical protein